MRNMEQLLRTVLRDHAAMYPLFEHVLHIARTLKRALRPAARAVNGSGGDVFGSGSKGPASGGRSLRRRSKWHRGSAMKGVPHRSVLNRPVAARASFSAMPIALRHPERKALCQIAWRQFPSGFFARRMAANWCNAACKREVHRVGPDGGNNPRIAETRPGAVIAVKIHVTPAANLRDKSVAVLEHVEATGWKRTSKKNFSSQPEVSGYWN